MRRSIIGERVPLEMGPDLLRRVEFGCIPGKFLGDDLRMLSQVGLDRLRAVVDPAAIPNHSQRTRVAVVESA